VKVSHRTTFTEHPSRVATARGTQGLDHADSAPAGGKSPTYQQRIEISCERHVASLVHQRPNYAPCGARSPLMSGIRGHAGAGGSTSELTVELCTNTKAKFGLDVNMHMTCTNQPAVKVRLPAPSRALSSAQGLSVYNN
jgi:hypothetical protein